MTHIIAVSVSRQVSPIIAKQLDLIAQEEVVTLSSESLEIKEGDSTLIRSMKENLIKSREDQDRQLGVHGAEIVQASVATEEFLLKEMRKLRKQADELQNKAKAQFNARTHLLKSGDILPIAQELGLIPSTHADQAKKYLDSNTVPDYFSEQKKVKGNK